MGDRSGIRCAVVFSFSITNFKVFTIQVKLISLDEFQLTTTLLCFLVKVRNMCLGMKGDYSDSKNIINIKQNYPSEFTC